ncbi:MAG: hypothetical protein O3C40_35660 [Planctomycetota bacterium]|nr:hypothetical protein [Planctomycetota bacterium]
MPQPRSAAQRELSTRGFASHDLRRILKLNDTLRNTRALVAQSEHAADSIALLLAETRVLVLRMGRYEFGQLAGMHFHAVKNAETPGTHPQHESLSRIYRMWNRLATNDREHSPRVRKQLAEACAKLLDLLVPEQDERGRPLRATVDGLYRIWMYQFGRSAFESASRKTNRQRTPLTYGTLWQRREVGMVPDFEEVRTIGTQLGRDLDMAAEIWEQQKTEQLLARGMSKPMVRFSIAIQLAFPELKMTSALLRKHLTVNEKTAQAINNGQMVGFDDIRHVVGKVIPSKDIPAFTRQWSEAWDRLHSQEDFATAFQRICGENAWNNHMLSTLLGVCPPEQRSGASGSKAKQKKVARVETYRPSAEVRRMYQENGFSGQAPAKAAIDLVASDEIPAGNGENQRQYLTRLFLEGVEQRLAQKGNSAHASPVRRHRILCGVTPQQLADVSGFSKADILRLEHGLREVSASEEKRLLELIESFPADKVALARARMTELTTPPSTIMEAVTRLRDRHGGYVPLSRALHDETQRCVCLSPARLKQIERRQDVPALPLLEHLVTRGGSQLTPELVRDWYDRIPQHLVEHPKLRWRHPLVRGFGLIVFEKWPSLYAFWQEQFQDDFTYSVVSRNFQQLNGCWGDFPWTTVSRYLNAVGLGVSDPRREFLQQLFERKDEITVSLNANNHPASLNVIRQVLKRWRSALRATDRDPRSVEYKLGLTTEERGSNL